MGQFSWITQDTGESIRDVYSNPSGGRRSRAYMHDHKGNVWEELAYEGYGVFGGKDYYQLLAEMNEVEGLTGDVDNDRILGINLSFNKEAIPFIAPNLTRDKNWTWENKAPQECPNQGWKDVNEDEAEYWLSL